MKPLSVNQHLQKTAPLAERLHRLAQNLYAEVGAYKPCDEPVLIETLIGYAASIEKIANELEVL